MADQPAPGFVDHLRLGVRDMEASARFWLILTPAAPEHAGLRHTYAVFFRDHDRFKLEVVHVRR
jgi:hypothetical protein